MSQRAGVCVAIVGIYLNMSRVRSCQSLSEPVRASQSLSEPTYARFVLELRRWSSKVTTTSRRSSVGTLATSFKWFDTKYINFVCSNDEGENESTVRPTAGPPGHTVFGMQRHHHQPSIIICCIFLFIYTSSHIFTMVTHIHFTTFCR